jgi:GT2 family glycosyltransferase
VPQDDPSRPLATVVVLNWNGSGLLPDCLDALAKQDLDPARWQTWVVDNGSTDDSLELLARDHRDVRVVENGANLGFAGGNNVALRAVETPFVVLLNNDAHPEPEWLRRLLAAAQAPEAERVAALTSKLLFEPRFLALELVTPVSRAPADPRELGAQIAAIEVNGTDVTDEVLWDHGAYGAEQHGTRRLRWTRPAGRLMVPLPREQDAPPELRLVLLARADRPKPLTVRWPGAGESGPVGEHTIELGEADGRHELTVPAGAPTVDVINNVGSFMHLPGYAADRGFQEPDTGQYDQPEDVFLMCGAAVCLRTAALREVGVFDDDFFMYYEDTDLSWRLQAAGWRIRYAPDAVVRHLHSASSGEWSPFFTFHVERNRLLVFTKNAPARFAAWLVFRFNLTTLSMIRRVLLQAVQERRRPAVRPLVLRIRVTASYLRFLPRVVARRRRIPRSAHHSPQALFDRWMQPAKPG